jgi:hypothetical protein
MSKMVPPINRVTDCPPWCGNRHPDEWLVHTRVCGEVFLDHGSYAVELAQYRVDDPPMVALSMYGEDEARVSNLTMKEARQLHAALEAALTLAKHVTTFP